MAATGSQASIGIIAETSYGVTPDTPVFSTFRNTGATLTLAKDTFQSEELRDDRQISDMRHGTKSVTGDIKFELSYGGVFDDVLEAALMGTWATSDLAVGTERRSFTIERKFGGAAPDGSDLFQLYTGVEFSSLSLTVQPSGIVTGSVTVLGKDRTLGTASAGTYSAPTTTPVFDAFSGSVSEGGSTLDLATEMTLSLENSLAARYVIGSESTLRPSDGRSNVTGQATVYYDENSLLSKFDDETDSSITFEIGDGTNSYTFAMQRVKYSGAATDVSDESPVTIPMPFQALLDSTSGTNLSITK